MIFAYWYFKPMLLVFLYNLFEVYIGKDFSFLSVLTLDQRSNNRLVQTWQTNISLHFHFINKQDFLTNRIGFGDQNIFNASFNLVYQHGL